MRVELFITVSALRHGKILPWHYLIYLKLKYIIKENMKLKLKNKYPTEHQEQVLLCKYLDFMKLKYCAVPNGIFLKDRNSLFAIMNKMKAEGLKKGFPDLLVFLPSKILFIELKKRKGGVISPEQKEWHNIINKFLYAKAVFCNGFESAKTIIEKELNNN